MKTALITGGCSGIGLSLARACHRRNIRVLLADCDAERAQQIGPEFEVQVTDVSERSQVTQLAEVAWQKLGRVDLLFSNAGVGAGTSLWESSYEDWEWVLGVNLWGTIHLLKEFVPRMLSQATPGHICVTASAAGLLPYHPSAPYQVSKSALITLAENLSLQLQAKKSQLGVSVICPGNVRTRILEAEAHRPGRLRNPVQPRRAHVQLMRSLIEHAMDPETVAESTFQAIDEGRFWVFTHPELNSSFSQRFRDIEAGVNPKR